MKSDLVDLTLHLHHETPKAILVSDDGVPENAKWLPKSQIEFVQEKGAIYTVTCPEWLAIEKEFV